MRRQSRQIMVGNVPVGGDAPITVQTMTNTPTEDVGATIDQIRRCEDAGADIIRVSCPTAEATEHFDKITKAADVPIVADIHFHYKRALEAADKGAACLRINPGNIGSSERVAEVVRAAKANGCAIRIGVNAGSLEKDLLEKYGEPCPEALVESALDHIKLLQDRDFHEFKVAVKASDVFLAVAAYQQLADAVDCPLHLGITEAGGLIGGTVKSAIGIGSLAPVTAIGRRPPPRHSKRAPNPRSGSITRIIGRPRKETSPVRKLVIGCPASTPISNRAAVPELPRSITPSASLKPPTPTPETRQTPSAPRVAGAPSARIAAAVFNTSSPSSRPWISV